MKYILSFLALFLSLSVLAFDRTKFYGEAVTDTSGKLVQVVENTAQTSIRTAAQNGEYVMVKVKNFSPGNNKLGRIRLAVWDDASNYAKEGVQPFRASSYWVKDATNGEMIFKIGGLERGKKYSFFAHFDKKNTGKINKIFGIPTEPYIFTNTQNQGKGPGLTREGLSAPKFDNTLVSYTGPGQEIILSF